MLDEGDQAARHEAARPDLRPATRDLADLDDAAGGRDLDPAAVLRRRDLEGLGAARPGIHHDLHPIATHARTVAPGTSAECLPPTSRTVASGQARSKTATCQKTVRRRSTRRSPAAATVASTSAVRWTWNRSRRRNRRSAPLNAPPEIRIHHESRG